MMKYMNFKWFSIALFFLLVIAYALRNISLLHLEYRNAKIEYEKLIELAYHANKSEPVLTNPILKDNIILDKEKYKTPIDFVALKEINPDVVGWIVINGTNINYPVVQSENNSYYLNHTFTNSQNVSGAIFMDYRNTLNLMDLNTIIYGHHMQNGTMFHDLLKYKDQTFYELYPHIIIYTSDHVYRYEIFASYTTSSMSETYVLDFVDESSFMNYLNMITDRSLIHTNHFFKHTNKIITLSTCDTNSHRRMVVHARLL